jgi:protein phosphatase
MDSSAPVWQKFLETAELSDVGLRRSNNQDNFGRVLAGSEDQWRRRGHLFIVADGMGAHAAGELASKMSVDTITHSYYKLTDPSPADALRKAVEEANASIHSRGQANPDFKGMGTTTSVLLILPEGAVVAHVGDSRVYRLRGNRLEQLSFDHSLVWEMTTGGNLSEREIPGYIPKNIITRSLGPSERVQVDLEGPFPLAEGDCFLLCSDGLSGQVADEELGTILGTLPPHEAVRTLVDLANLRGGPDNITVIVARVRGLAALPSGGSHHAPSAGAQKGPSINPILWVVFGVLLLVALMLFVVNQPVAAGAAAVAGLVSGMVIFWQRFATATPLGARLPARLGKGPHRSYVCNASPEFVDQLARIIEPLREEASQQKWDIDWARFNGLCSEAKASAARSDFAAAVRADCHAISFMMQELRSQRQKRKAGSVDIEGS